MKKNRMFLVIVTIIVLAAALAIGLSGCADSKPVIGILKFGNHESLNNCQEGIIEGLKEGLGDKFDDYKIDVLDSNFDSSASLANANALASKSPVVIGAIATPSALAAHTAANGRFPVVFSAVSDPYAPEVALDKKDNITGTQDLLDFDTQLDIIQEFLPGVKSIGVLRCTQEDNSKSQLATLKQKAADRGIKVESVEFNLSNEIPTSIDTLLSKDIDCITNLTDNTVVGSLSMIIDKANAQNIPVFGSEIEQVAKGCIASASLDYVELGRITGLMISDIILGKKTSDIPIKTIEESFKCYNSKVAAEFGIDIDFSEYDDVAI